MKWQSSIITLVFLLAFSAAPVRASMSTPEMGTYDRLLAYTKGQVNEVEVGLLGFAAPGFMQFRRGNTVEGLIQVGIEVGALMFMFRWEEEQVGGDTYRELRVNWWLAAVVLINHLYSGVTTYHWGRSENARLRLEYGVDSITVGVQF